MYKEEKIVNEMIKEVDRLKENPYYLEFLKIKEVSDKGGMVAKLVGVKEVEVERLLVIVKQKDYEKSVGQQQGVRQAEMQQQPGLKQDYPIQQQFRSQNEQHTQEQQYAQEQQQYQQQQYEQQQQSQQPQQQQQQQQQPEIRERQLPEQTPEQKITKIFETKQEELGTNENLEIEGIPNFEEEIEKLNEQQQNKQS